MKNTNDNIEKICNFYMSDWHFAVMILPYINNEINSNTQIITIFEKDISPKVKTLVDKLNLKNKDEILKINWKNSDIKNFIQEIKIKMKNNDKNILIINGTNSYINRINNRLETEIHNNIFKNLNIKIIDCYEFEENKDNMNSIIEKYDFMLNTSGEIKINSITHQ